MHIPCCLPHRASVRPRAPRLRLLVHRDRHSSTSFHISYRPGVDGPDSARPVHLTSGAHVLLPAASLPPPCRFLAAGESAASTALPPRSAPAAGIRPLPSAPTPALPPLAALPSRLPPALQRLPPRKPRLPLPLAALPPRQLPARPAEALCRRSQPPTPASRRR